VIFRTVNSLWKNTAKLPLAFTKSPGCNRLRSLAESLVNFILAPKSAPGDYGTVHGLRYRLMSTDHENAIDLYFCVEFPH
jgi:hypothetical protein